MTLAEIAHRLGRKALEDVANVVKPDTIMGWYRLNYIRAKRADTSFAWINSIFLVMNLLILLRIFFALCKRGVAVVRMSLVHVVERLVCHQLGHNTQRRGCLYQTATC